MNTAQEQAGSYSGVASYMKQPTLKCLRTNLSRTNLLVCVLLATGTVHTLFTTSMS
jgi:hypothetical protein